MVHKQLDIKVDFYSVLSLSNNLQSAAYGLTLF